MELHSIWYKKKREKNVPLTDKDERLRKILDAHENSTLESETGLPYIISIRRFLQSPLDHHVDPQNLCVQFALEEIEALENLSPSLSQINVDFHLRYAVEYHLGVYSLYAAQIKWYFPHIITDKHHIHMRDHYMHGIEHNYAVHMGAHGDDRIKKDIDHLFNNIKPLLLGILNEKKK